MLKNTNGIYIIGDSLKFDNSKYPNDKYNRDLYIPKGYRQFPKIGNILEAINKINNNQKYNQEIVQKYGECILCNKTFCLKDNNYD